MYSYGEFERTLGEHEVKQEKSMELWYLAHPMTGDDSYTFEQNKQHALDVQKILWGVGMQAVNTWFSFAEIFGVGEGAEQDRYLSLDKDVISALGGAVFVGHKMSFGMDIELRHALSNNCRVMNLIGIPNEYLAIAVQRFTE